MRATSGSTLARKILAAAPAMDICEATVRAL
jgi:hypothetical protein